MNYFNIIFSLEPQVLYMNSSLYPIQILYSLSLLFYTLFLIHKYT